MTQSEVHVPRSPTAGGPLVWDGVIQLDQIFAHAVPAYGGDLWETAIDQLLSWPAEKETIDLLRETAGADGLFTDPVRVGYDDEEGRWYVGNGMHRIAATHLSGGNLIRCTSARDTGSDLDEVVEMRIAVTSEAWPDGECDDMDYVVKWMRSFRLPSGTWVELFGGAGISGVLTFSWFCPHEHVDALVETLTARAARHRVSLRATEVTCTTIGALLDED